MMPTAGRNLQRAFDMLLPTNLRHIMLADALIYVSWKGCLHTWLNGSFLVEVSDQLFQSFNRVDGYTLQQHGFHCIDGRDKNRSAMLLTSHFQHGQNAVGLADTSIMRKLTENDCSI